MNGAGCQCQVYGSGTVSELHIGLHHFNISGVVRGVFSAGLRCLVTTALWYLSAPRRRSNVNARAVKECQGQC